MIISRSLSVEVISLSNPCPSLGGRPNRQVSGALKGISVPAPRALRIPTSVFQLYHEGWPNKCPSPYLIPVHPSGAGPIVGRYVGTQHADDTGFPTPFPCPSHNPGEVKIEACQIQWQTNLWDQFLCLFGSTTRAGHPGHPLSIERPDTPEVYKSKQMSQWCPWWDISDVPSGTSGPPEYK